jgi:pimeloyl-ACP methyl ester carboxylesterase
LAKILDLKQLVLCGHSFGSAICRSFAEKYPGIIEGLIIIGGISNFWSLGMTLIYKIIVADHKYYEQDMKIFDQDEVRDKIYQKYVDSYK